MNPYIGDRQLEPDEEAECFCPWCGKTISGLEIYKQHLRACEESNDDYGAPYGYRGENW